MTRILIADDMVENRYFLEILLRGNGYEVISAQNGVEALNLAREAPPDLIITDILMPLMDGFELCRIWKADALLQSIPLIFYTATYTGLKDEQFALSLGVDRFIIKPLEPLKLLGEIREVLAQTSHRPSPLLDSSLESEMAFLRQHNAALFHKLEKKIQDLEGEIEARKRSEQEIRHLNQHWQTTFDAMVDAVWILDQDCRILRCNRSSENLLGRSNSEMVGHFCWEIVHQSDRPIPECPFQNMLECRESQSLELHMGKHWFEVSVDPLLAENGSIQGAVHRIRDITSHKQAGLQIQEQLHELLRWQAMMVGREERNMELKGEINELLRRLGEPPRYSSVEIP